MRFGIVVFPGTWSDVDCHKALTQDLSHEADYIWHKETDLAGFDCIVLPGGFSYGDYLRTGAMAKFSPVMNSVAAFAANGGAVIGICNGFQILCESGLLPGVLRRNDEMRFKCDWVNLRVDNSNTIFSNILGTDQVISVPISHGEGNYYADESTLASMEAAGQIVFRYTDELGNSTKESNPNGSLMNIAGITNTKGNILGMMPHPERCCDPILGGTDGTFIFESIALAVQNKR
jgi:phosphoribosylformylglycinamidine synthase